MKYSFLVAFVFVLTTNLAMGQQNDSSRIASNRLIRKPITQAAWALHYRNNYQRALQQAKKFSWPLTVTDAYKREARLVGMDAFGKPKYYVTYNNTTSAATVSTNQLWEGGSLGLQLSGASAFLVNKLGIWDGGKVDATHQELAGRVSQIDNPASISDHSTHVAGTMIAKGINPLAKGMSYGATNLVAWDFNDDISEIGTAASKPNNALLISNHSYGILSGWTYSNANNGWVFRGNPGANEDFKFGYYSEDAQALDSITYYSPYYLIVKAAGNSRNQNGPAVGTTYYRYNSSGTIVNAGARPSGISSNDGYDIIPWDANAKNILTIGAVNGIEKGYTRPSDVVISSFSSWGPTDDGRIKPDLVADGVNVLSTVPGNSYAANSGTSMASPAVSGSLLLLQELYKKIHPDSNFLRSASVKGIAIHTADEAGTTDGPDYIYGWGLLNMKKSAEVLLSENKGNHLFFENTLPNKSSFSYDVVASGVGKLKATICWTDLNGQAEMNDSLLLNNRTPKLINDLDIRIYKNGIVYYPWKLDPANPAKAATKGDNIVDNVEQVVIDSTLPGEKYTIVVTHKRDLINNEQPYSLMISGVGGSLPCLPDTTSIPAYVVDSLSFSTTTQKINTGCKAYTTQLLQSIPIEINQQLPLYIRLATCNNANTNKAVKAFIDYNCNGQFEQSEQVAPSKVLNASNNVFSAVITTPTNLTVGNYCRMRIVVQPTNDTATVFACANTNNSSIIDFKLVYSLPSNDVLATGIVSPTTGTCSNAQQLVTIQLQNNGTKESGNIPLNVSITKNSTQQKIVAFNTTYPGSILPGNTINYTLQQSFNAEARETYTVKIIANQSNDQNRSNDTVTATFTIAPTPDAPTAAAEICDNLVYLKAINPSSSKNYFWYRNIGDSSIAVGANTSTINTANNTFYVSSGISGSCGLKNKNLYPFGGGYLGSNSTNYLSYTSTVPTILESARLYIRYPGKIDFYATDVANGYLYFLSNITLDVYATSKTPAMGVNQGRNYDNSDTGAIYQLNLPLPAGSHHILAIPRDSANIFRNNNITTNLYPFTIPNVISITGNSANNNAFYYYLYDMKIKTQDCISLPTKVTAQTAPVPTVRQSGDTLYSSISANNQWYGGLNGTIAITGATESFYKPTTPGWYSVASTDTFGCFKKSANFNFIITSTQNNNTALVFQVTPNPANDYIAIKNTIQKRSNVSFKLIDAVGKIYVNEVYNNFFGNLNVRFAIGHLPSGIYIAQMTENGQTHTQKIVINH